nr:MAG TPA: hypothetical protein [Caudoviricetes sp.]
MQAIINIIYWIYLILFPFALILTVVREHQNYSISDAPNKVLGFVYHLLTVWLILPIFIISKIIKI